MHLLSPAHIHISNHAHIHISNDGHIHISNYAHLHTSNHAHIHLLISTFFNFLERAFQKCINCCNLRKLFAHFSLNN